MKRIHLIIYAAALLIGAASLASCSEQNNEVEEYPDWKNTNEKYFDNLYTTAKAKEAGGDKTWKIIRKWSLDNSLTLRSYDNIVVNVLDSVAGAPGCPLYTDSVRVHYEGRLLPSTSYPDGYIFGQSYYGDYNPNTATPTTMSVAGTVDGFCTALQNMHVGDRWRVYVPYQLGYGVTANDAIPAYSTLVFDVTLVAYYRPDAEVPGFKSKGAAKGRWIGLDTTAGKTVALPVR